MDSSETGTDDAGKRNIVEANHAHLFWYMDIAQIERLVYSHGFQVVAGKDSCGRIRQVKQCAGLRIARLEAKIAGTNKFRIDWDTGSLKGGTVSSDSVQAATQRRRTS